MTTRHPRLQIDIAEQAARPNLATAHRSTIAASVCTSGGPHEFVSRSLDCYRMGPSSIGPQGGAPERAVVPRYLTMRLLRTCLTPLTLAATVPARFLASGVSTKPLNWTTPL